MSNLHIVYGFCEDQHKATLFEYLTQNTPILKVKTIGSIAEKSVFAALTSSLIRPKVHDVHWIQGCIPNKKKSVDDDELLEAAISRKKFDKLELSDERRKHAKKSSRVYRKLRNLTLSEKNWRQHVNRKVALIEAKYMIPTCKDAFSLAHNQQPTPYNIGNKPKRRR